MHHVFRGGGILDSISPIIYWENLINDESTYKGFEELDNYLRRYKYDHFFVFDNFGNFMSYGGHDFYVDTNKYLMRMLKYNTGCTAYYFDVVACKSEQVPSLQKAVQMYLNNYPV